MSEVQVQVGDLVHYVLKTGDVPVTKDHLTGQCRAALIVSTWGAEGRANLHVFLDGTNDGVDPCQPRWMTSVGYDPDMRKPGTWHFKEVRGEQIAAPCGG